MISVWDCEQGARIWIRADTVRMVWPLEGLPARAAVQLDTGRVIRVAETAETVASAIEKEVA